MPRQRSRRSSERGRATPSILAVLIIVSFLAGCSSIGPISVTRDRIDYVGAVADSWKLQTLLNIVRMRYGDAPVFLDVSSVVSSYTLQAQLALGGEAITDLTGSFVTGGASTAFTDKPTISYTPLTGDHLADSLLRPLSPTAIFSLIQAGYPADFVLRITVRAINGIYNRSNYGAHVRAADPQFYPLLAALRRIQEAGALGLRVVKQQGEAITFMSFPSRSADLQRDIEAIFSALHVRPAKGEITLSFGATQAAPNDIAVLSNSMAEILAHIAAGVEVPPEDIETGRTVPSLEVPQAQDVQDRPIVAIHSGAKRPADTYAAVQYRGTWYWIADNDFSAKRTFTFLMLFFSLAETGTKAQAPVLTIPAN
jgi:hypothetical protein